nr:hypothetical protein GCM10025732_45560 [Glycomyces mayteni]
MMTVISRRPDDRAHGRCSSQCGKPPTRLHKARLHCRPQTTTIVKGGIPNTAGSPPNLLKRWRPAARMAVFLAADLALKQRIKRPPQYVKDSKKALSPGPL